MKPDPSIRIRCSVRSAAVGCPVGSRISVSDGVAGSWVQDVETRTVGAQHRVPIDIQEHARMPQRTITAVAGDGPVVHFDDLGRAGGSAIHLAVCVLYVRAGLYDSDATHAFNYHRPGMRRRLLSAVLSTSLMLSGCAEHLVPP